MKGKGNISRKQFLTGSASVVFGAIFGKLSEHVYAEEKPENTSRENSVNTGAEERDWDELPLDMLSGAYLVSDPESELFGGTVEAEDYLLTQYFHVYPGLELMLTDTGEGGGKGGWVGFSKASYQGIGLIILNALHSRPCAIISIEFLSQPC